MMVILFTVTLLMSGAECGVKVKGGSGGWRGLGLKFELFFHEVLCFLSFSLSISAAFYILTVMFSRI